MSLRRCASGWSRQRSSHRQWHGTAAGSQMWDTGRLSREQGILADKGRLFPGLFFSFSRCLCSGIMQIPQQALCVLVAGQLCGTSWHAWQQGIIGVFNVKDYFFLTPIGSWSCRKIWVFYAWHMPLCMGTKHWRGNLLELNLLKYVLSLSWALQHKCHMLLGKVACYHNRSMLFLFLLTKKCNCCGFLLRGIRWCNDWGELSVAAQTPLFFRGTQH